MDSEIDLAHAVKQELEKIVKDIPDDGGPKQPAAMAGYYATQLVFRQLDDPENEKLRKQTIHCLVSLRIMIDKMLEQIFGVEIRVEEDDTAE